MSFVFQLLGMALSPKVSLQFTSTLGHSSDAESAEGRSEARCSDLEAGGPPVQGPPSIVLNLEKQRVVLALAVDFYLGCIAHWSSKEEIAMENDTRRGFFGKMAAIAAVFAGGSKLSAQQPAASTTPAQGATT